MSDEQAGILIKAICKYQLEGVEVDVIPELKFILKMIIATFKRDDDKYKTTCAKRSVAGIKGAKQKLAKAGKRKLGLANQADNENDNDNENDINTSSAPEGAVEEEAFYKTASGKKLTGQKLAWFEEFWKAFGYKADKANAADSWLKISGLNEDLFEAIKVGAVKTAKERPDIIAKGGTPKMAQGWLTARRWEDATQLELNGKKTFTQHSVNYMGQPVNKEGQTIPQFMEANK